MLCFALLQASRVNDFKVVQAQGADDRKTRSVYTCYNTAFRSQVMFFTELLLLLLMLLLLRRRPLSEDVIRRGSLSESKKA